MNSTKLLSSKIEMINVLLLNLINKNG